jgi:hypothetical protein
MKTNRPSAERLLAVFDKLHLVISETDDLASGYLLEPLSSLQSRTLQLLHLPPSIYQLTFNHVPT